MTGKQHITSGATIECLIFCSPLPLQKISNLGNCRIEFVDEVLVSIIRKKEGTKYVYILDFKFVSYVCKYLCHINSYLKLMAEDLWGITKLVYFNFDSVNLVDSLITCCLQENWQCITYIIKSNKLRTVTIYHHYPNYLNCKCYTLCKFELYNQFLI